MDQHLESRMRIPTEKGQIYQNELRQDMKHKLDKSLKTVEVYIQELSELPTTKPRLLSAESNLKASLDCYKADCNHYLDFLSRNKTQDSQTELDSWNTTSSVIQKKVALILDKIFEAFSQLSVPNEGDMLITENANSNRSVNSHHSPSYEHSRRSYQSSKKPASEKSGSSRSSSQRSDNSSLIARVKAKAEAAKAKLAIAEKEATLKKERSDIDIELDLLAQKKQVAAAEAEASCLERELNFNTSEFRSEPPNECESSVERTKQYVMSTGGQIRKDIPTNDNMKIHTQPISSLSPQAAPFTPHSAYIGLPQACTQPVFIPSHNSTNDQSYDIAKYLLKRDLICARFRHFDDKPEHYIVWKAEFLNMARDLRCTPLEEIGLLTNWLGPESSKHALSIRSSCAHNPVLGLQKLWNRLDERYGSAELVESALKAKLSSLPKIIENKRLYELLDILTEIDSVKQQPQYKDLFGYFDSSLGIKPIIQKLPTSLQEKWVTRAVRFKERYNTLFPPFSEFVQFIEEMSRIKNDPCFVFDSAAGYKRVQSRSQNVIATKTMVEKEHPVSANSATDTQDVPPAIQHQKCIIHKNVRHSLNDCRAFRTKPIQERKVLLKENKICYLCCDSTDHVKRRCQTRIKCKVCQSTNHCSALHQDSHTDSTTEKTCNSIQSHGGETLASQSREPVSVNSSCTEICGLGFKGKSCARIIPVLVYPKGCRNRAISAYAMLDDQSNKSLGKRELFDKLNVHSEHTEYLLTSCSGQVSAHGRLATGLVIESEDGQTQLDLPTVLECDEIPDNYFEVPTPDVANQYDHLRNISDCILPFDSSRKTLLLIGRDLPRAHHVLDQRLGPPQAPFAQKSPLGWTIVGDVCLSGQHAPVVTRVCKTFVMSNARSSILEPCSQAVKVQEPISTKLKNIGITERKRDLDNQNLFERTVDDNKVGTSVDDRLFLDIMEQGMQMGVSGKWVAPLPFRSPRARLPNNYNQAMRRANSLDASLAKNLVKREHFIAFMQKLIDNKHAEIAPPLSYDEEVWYLPLFGVYHPKKPHQIRGVFDSSAKCDGISLNDVLVSGPDLTNSLLGVLLRFRKEMVAIVADIQQMFYCFEVRQDHRNYLRFLWHRNNKLENKLIDYRMTVHVFGNSPSPSVAAYGLLKTALLSERSYGSEVKQFITDNFYVDDGLLSVSTSTDAIQILKKTQDALNETGGLRLHKIASNDISVMQAFQPEDLSKVIVNLDLDEDKLIQRSLGLNWNLHTDSFEFSISDEVKPITRRGILSTVNSLYDPLGFLSPFTILGKLILRKVSASTFDWDEPLPECLSNEWKDWVSSLPGVETVHVPRTFVPNISAATHTELWTYCDASEQAIAAVSYLRVMYDDGSSSTGFVIGKSKVAPLSGHTIPRLELCGAVLAVDVAQLALDQLQIEFNNVRYFTDSKVVLGYICNEKKRFMVYVANRVEKVRYHTKPVQWNYVRSEDNPADIGTRGAQASDIMQSLWLTGPLQQFKEVKHSKTVEFDSAEKYPLVNPDKDKEIKPTTLKTDVSYGLGSYAKRFENFSKWSSLVKAVLLLRRYIAKFRLRKGYDNLLKTGVSLFKDSETFIIKCVQEEVYAQELTCLRNLKPLSKNSSIVSLDPVLNDNGILCVGGRLKRMNDDPLFKNPIVIPGKNHIATLIIRMCHERVKHQGRHLTEGKVRADGFWITGCKRLVSSILHKCVICRKLRHSLESQKMSDLPEDRITPGQPPFSSVGVDIFGPWEVVTRRTRGGSANSKRWAALFTCLVTRAIHIEVVEEMSASSFINALRRFVAIRGKVIEFRSDRGTNFVGALDSLQINAIKVEDSPVKDFLYDTGTVWIFNSPHSSHMGGVWERMIGITRRILDSLLRESSKMLTHEVLTTFLAEASSIINSRPLVPVSSDTQNPFILTPSILLTQKTDNMESGVTLSDIDPKDLLRKQWKRVQHLANVFWRRWRNEYLHTLQVRRKWTRNKQNLRVGDVVLIRDKDANRCNWPMGMITRTFPSGDNLVRKVEVRVISDNRQSVFIRPVTELVLLLSP